MTFGIVWFWGCLLALAVTAAWLWPHKESKPQNKPTVEPAPEGLNREQSIALINVALDALLDQSQTRGDETTELLVAAVDTMLCWPEVPHQLRVNLLKLRTHQKLDAPPVTLETRPEETLATVA